MLFFKKKKILVTHNGSFHADDIFATAVLSIMHDGNVKIIRTRDPEIFKKGDYVYDVGGENILEKNLFDHHQKDGAGKRDNGIPYAAFGLVWNAYGEKICGSKKVAERIDIKIVQPIDANDNGVDIFKPVFKDISPYSVYSIFLSESPTWKEKNINIDKIFNKQVSRAIDLLKREIKIAKDDLEGEEIILKAYEESIDKRIIVVDIDFPRYLMQGVLCRFIEPIYFVYPSFRFGIVVGWKTEAVKKSPETMESRKLFPVEWRGVMESSGKLKEITGISGAAFCHQNGFFLTANSKESAIKLAEKALLG